MRNAFLLLLVVITISAVAAKDCRSVTYFNNFFNNGEQTVKKAFELGAWLEKDGWKKVPLPVVGSVAVLQPSFPGVSPVFGHLGRVTFAQTADGENYVFSITSTNQGCTVSEWHSTCHEEVDCDDVSEWRGLKFARGSSSASFYTPVVSSEDFIDSLPQEPMPQMPAGSGLCTLAHLRVRSDAGSLSTEVVVVPRGRELLDLDDPVQEVDGIAYRHVEYTNPMGESFSGWAADSYLGPCALAHYASDVVGSDEQQVQLARASEVSQLAPVEKVPGWSIGVMSALGGLALILLAAIVVLYLAVRHYRKQMSTIPLTAVSSGKDSSHDGFVQFSDDNVPTIAVPTA